jgi:hypothetical protein
MGGPVSFADGGDSNKEDALGLPSLSPDMSMDPNAGASNLAMIQSAMQPTQGMQGNAPMTLGQMPDQSNDSLIAKVTANLKVDPNYQPENPIEAAIVKQIKGTDPMQQGQPSLQGLGSLGPSQPMAPSYSPSQSMAPSFNPSVAMGPTYFAGINAPQGYADGGDIVAGEKGMNLGGNSAAALQGSSMTPLDVSDINVKYGYNPEARSSRGVSPIIQALGMGGSSLSGYNSASRGVSPIIQALGMADSSALGARSLMIEPPKLGLFADNDQIEAARSAYESQLAAAMSNSTYARGGYLDGPGTGLSDSIPATIEGKQPARLADGEFIVSSDVVSALGEGSSKAGSKRLYAMMDRIRQKAHGRKKQINKVPESILPA